MFVVGEKIIYAENGVCTVERIAPLPSDTASGAKLYYYLVPYTGSGTYFAPIDSSAYMRAVIDKDAAHALIDSIPGIEPAICNDNRFNHVDAYYKQMFKEHTNEALVSMIKGLRIRMADKKTKSSRAEATLKRAKEILHGELSVALGIDISEVENYISARLGSEE